MILRSVSILVALLVALSATTSFADKQDARDIATGASVLGAAGVLTPEPLTTAAGTGALIGQGVGFIGMGLWDLFAAAPANPDPNHGEVAFVTPVTFAPVAGAGIVSDPVNASMFSAASIIDNSRLLNLSLQRYYGAIDDGNTVNQQLQLLAASNALFSLESDINDYRVDLLSISIDVQFTDFAALSTTVGDVLALRDDIVLNGFPLFEDFVFAEMNATTAEINLAISEISLVNGNAISNADLTGAVIFDRYSSALGEVDLRELLPSGFTPVPEPSTGVMFAFGLISLAAVHARRRIRRITKK